APAAGAVAEKAVAPSTAFPPMQELDAPAPAKPASVAPAAAAKSEQAEGGTPVVAALRREGELLKLAFPFAAAPWAAVFRRYDTLWLVFDSEAPIDVAALTQDPGRLIRSAEVTRSQQGQVVRLKLDRPLLASASALASSWTVTLGDLVLDRT